MKTDTRNESPAENRFLSPTEPAPVIPLIDLRDWIAAGSLRLVDVSWPAGSGALVGLVDPVTDGA